MKIASYLFFASLIFLFASPANAQNIWSVKSKTDVLRGDANGVSIKPDGSISIAPKMAEIYRTGQPFVWSSVADRQGNVYLGTGGEGRIFRVSANGEGKLFADLDELNVTALALGNGGELFAATSPDGKVYKIDNSGKTAVYFTPGEKYIWSLAVMSDGSLAVGTGESGKIFRVRTASATPADSLFYDTSESHIITLATDRSGNLIAGTDSNGLVLRFSADGKPFALLDSPLREIHDLSVAVDGSIYVLALSESVAAATQTPAAAETSKPVTAEKTPAPEMPAKSRYDLSSAKSAVYRILPDGGTDIVWSSATVTGFSILAQSGGVMIGTSDKGRVYSVTDKGEETLLLQSDAGQVSNLFGSNSAVYASSSNQGVLYKIGAEIVAEGSYISPVFDAKNTASWGRFWWGGSGNISIETRSGNTETPNETWSSWEKVSTQASSGKIASPSARFIQWRAALRSGTAATTLNDVNLAYISRNIAPEILAVSMQPVNVGLLANPPMQIDPNIEMSGLDPAIFGIPVQAIPPRKAYQRGAIAFQWASEDRNSDKLVFDVYFKEDRDKDFKILRSNITENFITIDGLSLADGRYVIKVVANDSPSNPPELALSGEKVSEPFIVDNTQPVVTATGQPQITGSKANVTFNAVDRSSYIARAEYSVNGGNWIAVFPVDGISDGPEEQYVVEAELPASGEYSITLRVFDAAGNIGNARVLIRR